MITVLLADDHELVRSGFALMLTVAENIDVVGQVAHGKDAVAHVLETPVDVVLMDVQMPVMDGIEATRLITRATDTKVIILTTFDRDDYLFDALRAGASGFLLKNASPEDLVAAVHAVVDGHALLAPEATLRVVQQLTRHNAARAPRGATAGRHGRAASSTELAERTGEQQRIIDSLTAREREVLTLAAEGLSNGEICETLVVGQATVKTHISNVLSKVGARDRVQAVVFAYRSGLVS
ncbi:response regulator transcription factor [Kocuria sp. cx-116]|uniref:response regulator n=1 Tax=Kocuria sp. cx-116 TaxID=2771378 RepID=UPI0016870CC4|nr:response regulator transcription factor [Kocuria sp. cx-116]MBD2761185.1 response regulator transcription factor [Kocuria sp. cx-116]